MQDTVGTVFDLAVAFLSRGIKHPKALLCQRRRRHEGKRGFAAAGRGGDDTGAETLNPGTIQRKENLVQVAGILRELHASNVRFNNDFNVFREILNYEHLLEKSGAKMYDGYAEVRDQVLQLEDRLNDYGVELKACHNDMVAENYVKSDSGKIYLIDWEYSGMNDPHWEFAGLFNENNFSQDNREFFLHQYFGAKIPAYTWEKIFIYEILMDVLWAQWTVIKEAAGDDFGTYGPDRFHRALSNLKKIK